MNRNWIFLLFLLCMFFAASCGQKNNPAGEEISTDVVNNPATASPGLAEPGSAPLIHFYKESHDFSRITQGEKVSFSFRFKNTGGSDLLITSAQGSCGCTVPDFSRNPIKPGEEGQIDVSFNSEGRPGGLNEKTVTVVTNTVPNTKVLTITATVVVPEEKTE